jgi:aspartate/tyrosine/aromatic aminotransferase
MDVQFGENVKNNAAELQAQGRDANQIAKILFDKDDLGHNYGIGIILTGAGKPMASSSVLATYLKAELDSCGAGTYMNSAKLLERVKESVLRWQRIPEKYWPNFNLALPSDAGTGAVQSAIEMALLLNPQLKTIGIEELGWPAHKAIAKLARVGVTEVPQTAVVENAHTLPLYQAGPMNTTGQVRNAEVIQARAESASQSGSMVVLDRAYSGFEFARLINSTTYDEIMKKSFELQLKPFLDAGVTTNIAISPTKAFVTFAFRPCGFLLVYNPNKEKNKTITLALNSTIRARGSSFEHPVTRAFAKAMVNDLNGLEAEQTAAFKRLAESEVLWGELVKGTAIEAIFSEQYAGLFRNPLAKENAPECTYGSHLYPVFSQGRCRLNATGLPTDEELAKEHVGVFSQYCYE